MSETRTLVVTGSRSIEDKAVVKRAIEDTDLVYGPFDEILQGGANDVDSLAAEVASVTNWHCRTEEANWDLHGKFAGEIRNERMISQADAVVVVWDGESNGTRNCIDKALDQGKDLIVKVTDDE